MKNAYEVVPITIDIQNAIGLENALNEMHEKGYSFVNQVEIDGEQYLAFKKNPEPELKPHQSFCATIYPPVLNAP